MRRFHSLPQTLPGWVLFIVIGGLLISHIASFAIASIDRADANDVLELYRLNERAFSFVKLLSTAQDGKERKDIAAALSNSGYALTISENPVVASAIAPDDSLAELEDVMTGRLAKFGVIDARVRRDPASTSGTASRETPEDPDASDVERDLLALAASFAESDKLTASVQFADGTWLNFTTPTTPLQPMFSRGTLPLYVTVAVLVVAMTAWSIRRLTAPYRLMEQAVKRIGVDLKSPPVSENGSREYRAAAQAVNSMQAKLREYVEDREQLAAALAHDLRTPLTRMRLRMEKLHKSPLRNALMHDIGEIETIARSVVDFATLEVTDEEPERIDFGSLVYSIADRYSAVSLEGDPPRSRSMICEARPVALKRCITNLLDNAIAYGKKAHLSLAQSDLEIVLTILDEGPGIPEEHLDAVFRPFVRVEKSRNRQTGGLGLGLTIARNIARTLGGEIRLSNGQNGGLRAELRLPQTVCQ
jgi:signal transduction histidine kinase